MAKNMTNILVVEDDKFLADAYRNILELKGFNVELSYNGQEGLNHLDKHQPDLILLDINMPVIDGVEFLERIKTNSKLKKIPVLLITGIIQTEKIGRCLDLGATGYIEKAHSPVEVLNKIETILGNITRKGKD